MINKNKLRKLREYERNRKINMLRYGPDFPDMAGVEDFAHSCETAGCHAGYTLAMEVENVRGYLLPYDGIGDFEFHAMPKTIWVWRLSQ